MRLFCTTLATTPADESRLQLTHQQQNPSQHDEPRCWPLAKVYLAVYLLSSHSAHAPAPLFASSVSTNLSTQAHADFCAADPRSTFSAVAPGSTAESNSTLSTPLDSATALPHPQRAGPDTARHSVSSRPLRRIRPSYLPPQPPPDTDAPSHAGTSPLRKPELVRRLKERMHVGHART
ncbi:hypothetical protein B0H17DRAFT_1218336 [Mycena rosella]|uniref:Uncharacterized protein n=1 Tax=Mycena rosella TaxID=1033263 RepID=A0AAD7BQQ4_MYCRO|nr:hypothetical protein B0H17DRAFT_1218336 [Mycena rosella]